MRHSMFEKAWLAVIVESLAEETSKASGQSKEAVIKAFNDRHKEKYQQELEKIENKSPERAAQLDTRGPDDIIP
jgi:ABC-type transporter MlaC component